MNIQVHEYLNNIKQSLVSADLTKPINRLIFLHNWSKEQANEASHLYKNYLYLKAKYPNLTLPPSEDIDEFWHAHILHTEDYQTFCQNIFGKFIHHHPDDGYDTNQKWTFSELFENETQKLYYLEFGDYLYQIRYPIWAERLRNFFNKIQQGIKQIKIFFAKTSRENY